MGMHHSFSGKQSYNYYYCEDGGMEIDRDTLEKIVIKEDEFRRSEKWQKEFAKHDTNQWRVQCCDQLQREAILWVQRATPDWDEIDMTAALITLR